MGWSHPPHDTLLRAATDLDLIGLVVCAAAYAAVFFYLRGIAPEDALYRIKVALLASLCGLGFASFFIDLSTAKYAWVVLAAVAQLHTVARPKVTR